jgi:type I restriction-modification system DNA methylase subunit
MAKPTAKKNNTSANLGFEAKLWAAADPCCGLGGMFVQSEKFIAWVQHFIHHLAPTGLPGFVLANGLMSSNQPGEGDIRKAIIEADLVDCMMALPGQLFYSMQIPVCLWFFGCNKSGLSNGAAGAAPGGCFCDWRKEKMRRLAGQLNDQFNEGARLDQAIGANLAMLGFPLETQP